MTDTPYPGAPAPPHDTIISYSLREVIDQINRKLDLLPGIVSDQATMKAEAKKLEARVLIVEAEISTLKEHEDKATGAALFKDRFMAKLVGLASVMGIVAGITVQIVQSFQN